MKNLGVNLFELFSQFPDEAPKSLRDFPKFVEQCRESGKTESIMFLESWLENIYYQIEAEWRGNT